MNTKIEYLYRDADNYKTWNEVIVPGEITEDQKKVIMKSLDSGEYFIPEQIGLPIERPDDELTEADHCFCELEESGITLTDEPCTELMSVNELTERFRKAGKDGWDAVKYGVDVGVSEMLGFLF